MEKLLHRSVTLSLPANKNLRKNITYARRSSSLILELPFYSACHSSDSHHGTWPNPQLLFLAILGNAPKAILGSYAHKRVYKNTLRIPLLARQQKQKKKQKPLPRQITRPPPPPSRDKTTTPPMDMELDEARHGFGKMGFGCKHYRRRCRIRAPCCNDVFHCRHCHNESTKDGHELDRHAVESVICLVCDTEQPIAQVCTNCGVCMGEYFCRTCKFLDDDVDKEQYHCKDCGICRVGGKDNFFHCQKCGSCYSVTLRDKHRCIEDSMKNNCPICYEYLFDSLRETSVLRCGHTMHLQCFHELLKHDKFSCPMCSMSIFDMEKFLRALDAEIEANFLQTDYVGKGWIVCNDCRDTTRVYPGMAGHRKCCHCQSYNTCRVAPPVLPA